MAKKTASRKKTSRKTSKKTSKKKVARKTTKKTASGPSVRIPKAEKPRTKSEMFSLLAEGAGISKKDVASVFDTLAEIAKKDLSRNGPGAVNVGGLMKVTVQRKPATRARKGINPFTGEETTFKAKPARNVVKIRPLKNMKDLV